MGRLLASLTAVVGTWVAFLAPVCAQGADGGVAGKEAPAENPLSPVMWYVDGNSSGPAHDGTSWCTAFTTLQDALAAASSATSDTVLVADGVYRPDRGGGQTLGDRYATFRLKERVVVQGGYAGCGAPDPDAWDVVLYETTLSGDLNGDDGPDFANNGENSYHVVTGATNDTAVLDGFTIRGGNANGEYSGGFAWGGGLLNMVRMGSTVIRCKFVDNTARLGGNSLDNWSSTDVNVLESVVADSVIVNLGSTLTLYGTALQGHTLVGPMSVLDGDGTVDSDLYVCPTTGDGTRAVVRANAPGKTLTISGTEVAISGGLLEASDGGTLLLLSDIAPELAYCKLDPCLGELSARGGSVQVGEDVSIEAATVTISAGGSYAAQSGGTSASGAALSARDVTVTESQGGGVPGAMVLSGSMSVDASQNFSLQGNLAAVGPSETPPILKIIDAGRLSVGGLFAVEGSASLTCSSLSPVYLTGSFDNRSIRSSGFDWREGGIVLGNAGAAPAARLEAAARDRGTGVFGPEAEYEFGSLRIESGKRVTVSDEFDNDTSGTTGVCTEALYVRDLVLDAGSELDVSGVNLYYRTLSDGGATISTSGCAALVRRTDVVFGQTVTARGYCQANPAVPCSTALDCPSGPCLDCAFEWLNAVEYEYALGDFTSSADIGSYATDERGTSYGNYFVDDTTPASGTGLWYLFRLSCPQGGCSWQSALGAEPGRDAALP